MLLTEKRIMLSQIEEIKRYADKIANLIDNTYLTFEQKEMFIEDLDEIEEKMCDITEKTKGIKYNEFDEFDD